jgi:AraC-like DNA-binding protein/quercetin dioxygenase-like cupin family protein
MSHKPKPISTIPEVNRLQAVVIPQDYPNGHTIDWHCHAHNQLVYASSGVMAVETKLKLWVIPPLRAVWIPAYELHKVYMYGNATMKNVYLLPDIDSSLPDKSEVINVSPMMREMIMHLSLQPYQQSMSSNYCHIVQVLLDQIKIAPQASIQIPLPKNEKLALVCTALLQDPASNRSLKEWARVVNVSSRTLTRLFRADIGVTFVEYRQQVRLFHALRLLSQEQSVTTISYECGFSSLSAFNYLFKKNFGVTPGQFFKNAP